MKKERVILLVANGEIPNKKAVSAATENVSKIIAADGGSKICRLLNIDPDIIVGDLDSSEEGLQSIFPSAQIMEMKDQNHSDMEKAIQIAMLHNPKRINIIAASGARSDHTLVNLLYLENYFGNIEPETDLYFYDNWGKLRFLSPGRHKINVEIGKTVSLFSFNGVDRISLKGFKYELNDYYNKEVFYSLSNVYSSNEAVIDFEGKGLVWYECY